MNDSNHIDVIKELVSVIVPVYKVERDLPRCIESIRGQLYKNIEIILVDDGSPDQCPKMCDEYAKLDTRIKVIHKKNGGLSSARNTGLDMATGEYIMFVDSDDFINRDFISILYEGIKRFAADMSMCSFEYVNEKGEKDVYEESNYCNVKTEILNRQQMFKKIDRKNEGYWFYVVAWNKLYHRTIFDNIRFPEGKIYEDEFMIHHVISQTSIIYVTEKKLYNYVQRKNSIMHTTKYTISRLDAVEALIDRYEFYLEHNQKKLATNTLASAYEILITFIRKSKKNFLKAKKFKNLYTYILKHLFVNFNCRCIKLFFYYMKKY